MLDIDILRNEPDRVRQALTDKNGDPALMDKFAKLDSEWRAATTAVEEKRAEQKKLSAARDIEGAKKLKEEIKKLENKIRVTEEERLAVWKKIPNLPSADTPVGRDESGNVTLREAGEKPSFDFQPKDYLALAERLGMIDMERAAKVSGSRFGYILGDLVKMEFGLVQLALQELTDRTVIKKIISDQGLELQDTPFTPVLPPVLVSRRSMEAMGYLERGEDEIYHLPKDDMFLVGTSEQSLGPFHMDEILAVENLPLRYMGFSTCFRREAGSHGKDTKGILRVHQFNKLEMFSFTTPEASGAEHKLLLAIEEYLMQKLELPYRVLNICSGDLGDPAAAKFDVEAWLPGQNEGKGEHRETHSTSNCTDYQARRLNVRYRDPASGKPAFVHTLNGTVFSERPLIAIMENYQTKEGAVRVPKILQSYVGKDIIAPADMG
jgi:seryl-tRNA synthetase